MGGSIGLLVGPPMITVGLLPYIGREGPWLEGKQRNRLWTL